LVLCACLAHVAAYVFVVGTLLAAVAAEWLQDRSAWRRLALQLLPAAPGFLLVLAGIGGNGNLEWNTLQGKLLGSVSLVFSYNPRFDTAVTLVLLGLAILVVWRGRDWSVHRGM